MRWFRQRDGKLATDTIGERGGGGEKRVGHEAQDLEAELTETKTPVA